MNKHKEVNIMTTREIKYTSIPFDFPKEYYKGRPISHVRDTYGNIIKTFYTDNYTEVVYDEGDKPERNNTFI